MINCDLKKYGTTINADVKVCAISYRHSPEKHWKVGFYATCGGENMPIEDIEIPYIEGTDPIKQAYSAFKDLEFASECINT